MKNELTLPGGMTVNEFLAEYWQKKPLLIRQAIPGFKGLLDPQQLKDLSCSPDAQARLVRQKRGQWQLEQGPFEFSDFSSLGKTKWTLLLQGINHILPEGAALLQQFSFIPYARLDDLMVSFAPAGGGVGPHFDSYDVFLLQGMGHRRWQISKQDDRTMVEGAPLRILKNFSAEEEWILAPGDMLYLPPQWAHDGIAVDDCMTYSVGFRAPSYQELGEQFLVHLQDHLCLDGMYADPELKTQTHPSEISKEMLIQVENAISQIKWSKTDISNFLGCYLSDPKPHIYFDPPEPQLTRKQFKKTLASAGVIPDLKSQILCYTGSVFVNGISFEVNQECYNVLRVLADNRKFSGENLPDEAFELLYQWYVDGYLIPVAGAKGNGKQ